MNATAFVETILVTQEESSLRLDKLLALRFPEHSRTYFQSLIEKEFIQINGISCKKRERTLPGDTIQIQFELPPEMSLTPEKIPLDILFEDEDLIIVNKPAGMVVHPAPGNYEHTFVNALLYHCQNLEIEEPHTLRPGIVHRLDKNTSGVLMAAKTIFAHHSLVKLLSQRQVEKTYEALCFGIPSQTEIITQIRRHPIKRQEMAVCEEGGKEAITRLNILKQNTQNSHLTIKLITGRTHQIRVHLKHIHCPILGDPVYGNIPLNTKLGISRQLLHAKHLSFKHPKTEKIITVTAPIPSDMQYWIDKLFI